MIECSKNAGMILKIGKNSIYLWIFNKISGHK